MTDVLSFFVLLLAFGLACGAVTCVSLLWIFGPDSISETQPTGSDE